MEEALKWFGQPMVMTPCVLGVQQFFQSKTSKLCHDAIYVTVSSHIVVSKEANDVHDTQVLVEEAS